jgi:hypothetical protein
MGYKIVEEEPTTRLDVCNVNLTRAGCEPKRCGWCDVHITQARTSEISLTGVILRAGRIRDPSRHPPVRAVNVQDLDPRPKATARRKFLLLNAGSTRHNVGLSCTVGRVTTQPTSAQVSPPSGTRWWRRRLIAALAVSHPSRQAMQHTFIN